MAPKLKDQHAPVDVKAVYGDIGFAALKIAYEYLQFWTTPHQKLLGPKRKSLTRPLPGARVVVLHGSTT
jgi:hypothetical protein